MVYLSDLRFFNPKLWDSMFMAAETMKNTKPTRWTVYLSDLEVSARETMEHLKSERYMVHLSDWNNFRVPQTMENPKVKRKTIYLNHPSK